MGRQEERSEAFSVALQYWLSVWSDDHSKTRDAVCDKAGIFPIAHIGNPAYVVFAIFDFNLNSLSHP